MLNSLENKYTFISVKNVYFALLHKSELIWEFEFLTVGKYGYSLLSRCGEVWSGKNLPTFLKNLFPPS
jgi:hypothetical protein